MTPALRSAATDGDRAPVPAAGSGDLRPSAPRRRLRRNFSAALIGNVVYAASQFGMLVVIAQLTSPVEVGRYALALAVTGPVFVFTGLKLAHILATDAAGEFGSRTYVGLRILSSGVALAGTAGVILVAGMPGATSATVATVAVAKAAESLVDILYGALQRRQRMSAIAASQIIRGLLGLALFTATLAATHSTAVAALALAGVSAVQVVTNARRVRALGITIRPTFQRAELQRLTRLAAPLGLAVTVGALTVNVPRYLLEALADTTQLGIFAVLSYVLVTTATLAGSLSDAATPRLADLFAAKRYHAFRSTLVRLVAIGLTIGAAGIVFAALVGRPALSLVFGPEYATWAGTLVVLMVAAALQYGVLFLGTAVNAMRLFTVQLPINVAALASVAAAGALLVPGHGLTGAALAVLTGQVVHVLCYGALTVRVVLPRLRDGDLTPPPR